LSKKMCEALNGQILKEGYSSNLYLAMASWAEVNGLRGSAAFLYNQAEEENEHMMKLFKYVNEVGGHAIVPELKQPPSTFKSLAQIFESALEHEKFITKSIHKLVEQSLDEKDFATNNFLQWYVSEQVEEEALFNSIMDIIKLAGIDGRGLYLVDHQIGKIKDKEEKS